MYNRKEKKISARRYNQFSDKQNVKINAFVFIFQINQNMLKGMQMDFSSLMSD